jgi:NAD(P)H-hydrate epimerase
VSAPRKKLRAPSSRRLQNTATIYSLETLPLSLRVLPSAKEMRALDEAAMALGVTSAELMERAGKAVAEWIKASARELPGSCQLSILCGPGNNGGDGLVALRLLKKAKGMKACAFVVAAARYSSDFLEQLSLARAAKCRVCLVAPDNSGVGVPSLGALPEHVAALPLVTWSQLEPVLASDGLVVDALLGTGQNSAPQGEIEAGVRALSQARECGARVLSVDIPTGVDASEGNVFEPAVQAHETLAIECLKRGMLQYPARGFCGVLKVAPLGILKVALGHVPPPPLRALFLGDPLLELPTRPVAAHKGNMKRVLVVGGSRAMPGAPVLSGEAALRAGAALVSVTYVQGSPPVLAAPELMRICLEEDPSAAWWPQIAEWTEQQAARGAGVLVLGPGLGTGDNVAKLVELVIALSLTKDLPLVLDADGLSALAGLLASGKRLKLPKAVLTPHPGEMARLIAALSAHASPGALSATEIQAARYSAASYLASTLATTVVLKGASTVIASEIPEEENSETQGMLGGKQLGGTLLGGAQRGAVNLTGTPWMATGGSGDVLAGIIAGFLAQGLEPFEAATAGAYYHGRAGEIASANSASVSGSTGKAGHPIISSDLITFLPQALDGKFSGASKPLRETRPKPLGSPSRLGEVH